MPFGVDAQRTRRKLMDALAGEVETPSVTWHSADPAFVAAIESRYLAEARLLRATGTVSDMHETLLATAIFRADSTNGGLRYRALDAAVRAELNDRLLRFTA